jgi:hypothetical protein
VTLLHTEYSLISFRYARQLEKKGLLKLVYVMMQEECVAIIFISRPPQLLTRFVFVRYTTVSQPEFVDGWLGVQLSDRLWFPCWNIEVMSDSAAKIAHSIVSRDRCVNSTIPHANSMAPSSLTSTSSSQAQFLPTATALLQDRDISKQASSHAIVEPGLSTVDSAPFKSTVSALQTRLDEVHASNAALTARFAATERCPTSSDATPAYCVEKLCGVVEALLRNQEATQDRHQASLKVLQDSLVANQRSLQEALISQVHHVAIHMSVMFVIAAIFGAIFVRWRS